MHGKLLRARTRDGADPGIVPDIGAVAPGLAKTEAVGVFGSALLEHEHQLVLGTIERPHAAVGLVPHHEVLELGEALLPRREQFSHVAPVHADKGNGTVAHHRCGIAEGIGKEGRELGLAHLARGKGELAVLDRAQSADIAINLHVVGRVREHEVSNLTAHQGFEVDGAARIPAQQPVAPELPEVALTRDCETRSKADLVVLTIELIGISVARLIKHQVNLGEAEPGELGIELKVDQRLQLDRQDLLVPASI